jgi:hypothetical protein
MVDTMLGTAPPILVRQTDDSSKNGELCLGKTLTSARPTYLRPRKEFRRRVARHLRLGLHRPRTSRDDPFALKVADRGKGSGGQPHRLHRPLQLLQGPPWGVQPQRKPGLQEPQRASARAPGEPILSRWRGLYTLGPWVGSSRVNTPVSDSLCVSYRHVPWKTHPQQRRPPSVERPSTHPSLWHDLQLKWYLGWS